MKIIRFYSERLSRNFIVAFDWYYSLLVLLHSLLQFVCAITVLIDCEFAGGKFIGIYVYVDDLVYRFTAAAIL